MKNQLKKRLRQFHRWIGIFISAIVLVLSITGILLNHTEKFSLAKHQVKSPWLLEFYGINKPEISSWKTPTHWVSFDGNMTYIDQNPLTDCLSLEGAIEQEDQIFVACNEKLVIASHQAEVIEIIDDNFGLPIPLEGISLYDGKSFIQAADKLYQFGVESLSFMPVQIKTPKIAEKAPTPDDIAEAIIKQSPAYALPLERIILDLHSGRIFGFSGVIFMDFAAILLIFMSFSGLLIWLQNKR